MRRHSTVATYLTRTKIKIKQQSSLSDNVIRDDDDDDDWSKRRKFWVPFYS